MLGCEIQIPQVVSEPWLLSSAAIRILHLMYYSPCLNVLCLVNNISMNAARCRLQLLFRSLDTCAYRLLNMIGFLRPFITTGNQSYYRRRARRAHTQRPEPLTFVKSLETSRASSGSQYVRQPVHYFPRIRSKTDSMVFSTSRSN